MNEPTIRNISASPSRYLGSGLPRDEDCRVPEGAIVQELKLCENCGNPFLRRQRTGRKFCARCCQRYLLPEDDTAYRQLVAELSNPEKPRHLVHYDDSVKVVSMVLKLPKPRKSMTKLGDWVSRLTAAIDARGALTAPEMVAITGHTCSAALWASAKSKRVRLVNCGHYWEPRGQRRAHIYRLEIN